MAATKIKKCQMCLALFTATRKDAKTCSATCRKRLHRTLQANTVQEKVAKVERVVSEEFHRLAGSLLGNHVAFEPLLLSDETGSIPVVEAPPETTENNLASTDPVVAPPTWAEGEAHQLASVAAPVSVSPAAPAPAPAQPAPTQPLHQPGNVFTPDSAAPQASTTPVAAETTTNSTNSDSLESEQKTTSNQNLPTDITNQTIQPTATNPSNELNNQLGTAAAQQRVDLFSMASSSGPVAVTDKQADTYSPLNFIKGIFGLGNSEASRKRRNWALGLVLPLFLIGIGGSIFFSLQEKNHQLASNQQQAEPSGPAKPINFSDGYKLSTNVPLEANQSIIISPTAQPKDLQKGQIFFDQTANELFYYNGTEVIGLNPSTITINGQGGDVALGSGLGFSGGTLSNSGVTGINGTANQINVNHATGSVTLSLPQNIGTASTPTFAGLNLASALPVSEGGTGATSFAANTVLLGNGSGALQSTNVGSTGECLIIDSGGTPTFQNCASGGGVFAGGSQTPGTLTKFDTTTNQIVDSLVSESGSTVTVNGDLSITGTTSGNGSGLTDLNASQLTSGTIPSARVTGNYTGITGTGALTTGSIASGFGTISTGNNITTSATIQGGVVNATTTLQLGGTNINTGGTLSNVAYLDQDNTLTGHNLFQNFSNSTTAFQIQNSTGTSNLFVADTTNTRIGIGTAGPGYRLDVQGGDINTSGMYRANGSQISSANLSNDANLAKINGSNIFSAANTFSSTVAIQGANSLTLGTASNVGSVIFRDGASANTGTLQLEGTLGGNVTYNLPTSTGTQTVCTIETGNCAGSGSGVTGSGTINKLAKFTDGQEIGDSSITDDGSTVTVSASQVIQGAAGLTIGANAVNGQLVLKNSSNANTLTLQSGVTTSNLTLTLPTGDGSNGYCLKTNGSGILAFASCTGGPGGGVTSVNALSGTLNLEGTANQISVSSAGDTITLSLPQDINIGGNAAFRTITLTGADTADNLIVANALSGATGKLLDLKVNNVSKVTIDASGNINTVGQYQVNGLQISSANLSNDANLAKLDGTGPQTFTGNNLFKSDSTTAFQVQNSAGTSNLFVADTTNTRIGIGTPTPGYTLDANGDINTSGVYRIGGNTICSASGCTATSGSGSYVQNGTVMQTANFNIQSAAAGSVTAVIQGANSQSADLLQLKTSTPFTVMSVGATGAALFKNSADSTAAFQIQNAGGQSLFVANTTAQQIAIGPAAIPANGVLTIGTNTTATSGGIYFGTDTNLYRSAGATLTTDTALTVGGTLAVAGGVSGGGTGASGGTGGGASGDDGGAGGGAIGTVNGGSSTGIDTGITGAQSIDISGLFAVLTNVGGFPTTSPGAGSPTGSGVTANINHGGSATGFGCGGGGAGFYGGNGGNGLYGGGGGGAAGFSATNMTGGAGGQGVVVISPVGGTNVVKTSGSSYTVPAGITTIKVWAIGAGGGGGGATDIDPSSGGGGGAGGVAYRTFVVVPGNTISYSLGTGGAGGIDTNNGTDGGSTTFTVGATTITANGGAGGKYNNAATNNGGTFSSGNTGSVVVNGGLTVTGNTTLFQNYTNSTTAFQVQNTAGTNIFNVDTTNSKIGTANTTVASTDSAALTIKSGDASGSTSNSGAVTIDSGTATGTAGNISIGTGAYAHNVTIGNTTGSSAVTIQGGTGAINIGTQAVADTITIGNSTGASSVVINNGTGALNIGTNAIAHTITLGNSTGATSIVANCGTGACSFGTNAIAHTTTVGSLTGAATTTIQGGTGGVNLGTGGIANTIQIGNTTGGVAQTINIGNNGTGGSTNTVVIGSTIAGATTLQSAGGVSITTLGSADTATFLCRNSSNIIATCTSSGTSFNQSGNSFGATATLGTTDNNGLNIITNSATVASLSNSGAALFKNASNSTAGFQVQNSSGNELLTVDTTNSKIILGKANTVNGTIDFKSSSSAYTVTLQAGATGSTNPSFTLPTADGTTGQCLQTNGSGVLSFGACIGVGTTGTLQQSYDTGASITTSDARDISITLANTATDSNFIVNTAASSTSKFAIQSAGTDAFSITNVASAEGSALFKNKTDNTTGFQVQNSSGNALLTADTTNTRLYVGVVAGSTTGTSLVLSNDTNATYSAGTATNAPTEVDGAMFYSSTNHSFLCGTAGSWQTCTGLLYSNTSAPSAVNTCTTACAAFNVPAAIPANYCQAGRVIRLTARGIWSSANASIAFGIYYGTDGTTKTNDTLLGDATQATLATLDANNWGWSLDTTIICFDTTHMMAETVETSRVSATATTTNATYTTNTSSSTSVTSNSAKNLYVFPAFSTSAAGNTATLQQLVVTGN